jgi:hypothetical protein
MDGGTMNEQREKVLKHVQSGIVRELLELREMIG